MSVSQRQWTFHPSGVLLMEIIKLYFDFVIIFLYLALNN